MSQGPIPSFDISEYTQSTDPVARAAFVKKLGDAYREWGFAGIRNHGISGASIDAAYDVFKAFFALPEDVKKKYQLPGSGGARGYTPFGIETAKGATHFDLKEFFHIGREIPRDSKYADVMQANIWPSELPEFKSIGYGLYEALDGLGNQVLEILATDLGLAPDFFVQRTSSGNSILRPIHYPPVPEGDVPNVRAGEHEDINLITLLVGASAEGLEVKSRKGEWVPFTADADTIVVNIGDMLQRLTNHVYPSTTHRVVNPKGENARAPRYSTPFFLHLNPDASVGVLPSTITPENPSRYPEAITANEYLMERLREIKLV